VRIQSIRRLALVRVSDIEMEIRLDMYPTRVIDSRRSKHILRKGLTHFMSRIELHVFVSIQTAVSGGVSFALSEWPVDR